MRILLSIALLLPLQAWSASAQTPRSTGPGPDRFAGAVYSNWHAAVAASGIDLQQPIELKPVAVRQGVALYELVGLHTGETASVYVSLPRVPAAPAGEDRGGELGSAVEAACATPGYINCGHSADHTTPDASRCTVALYANINFSTAPLTTNVDWNTLSDTELFNDEISSLTTTCAPVYFFKDANWSGYGLYIPANTSVSDLRTYGFNDSISSLYHVLP